MCPNCLCVIVMVTILNIESSVLGMFESSVFLYIGELLCTVNNGRELVYLCKLTCIALRTRPTFQACLVSVRIAGVVSEELVTWPTELVAAEAVVVFIAGDPDLVVKLGDGAVVGQPLPLSIWVDHA